MRSAGAVLVAVVGLVGCGDEPADETAGAAAGAAVAREASDTTGSSSGDGSATDEPAEPSGGSDGPPPASPSSECPADDAPPVIPAESPPPTMAGDMEPGEIPNGLGSDEMLPQFGELIVDVPENGCVDIPTSFRANQRFQVFTHADDEKFTHIEMFAPNGQRLAEWRTGEPETLEGWDFYNDPAVPVDGVYIFRVTHERGSHEPFVISFYGQA